MKRLTIALLTAAIMLYIPPAITAESNQEADKQSLERRADQYSRLFYSSALETIYARFCEERR